MYHRIAVVQFSQMLTNLSRWLDKAKEHGESLGCETEALLTSRLYVNQWPLRKQVQAACDTSKLTAARLTGKEAPVHEDTNQSLDELKARIEDVKAFLAGVAEADFEGAAERKVALPFAPGKYSFGRDYFVQFALPNFVFHINMAYGILRKSGVPLGKIDYIGMLDMHDE